MINILNLSCSEVPENVLKIAHNSTVPVSLALLWITFVLGFLILGFAFKSKGKSLGSKFWWVWFLTSLFGLGVGIFISLSPNFVQSVARLFGF